jgi:hypothetical protein
MRMRSRRRQLLRYRMIRPPHDLGGVMSEMGACFGSQSLTA